MKLFLASFIVLTLLLSGCTTSYLIDSRPSGATVYSGTTNLGNTPIELSMAQVTEKLGEGGLIRIEAVGHYPLTVWVPNSGQKMTTTINLNPLKLSNKKSTTSTIVSVPRLKINSLTDQLLDYQSKLLQGQKVPSADLVKMVSGNPTLGSIYFLTALSFISENNANEGKNYAAKAARLSPLENDFHILLEAQSKGDQGQQGQQAQ